MNAVKSSKYSSLKKVFPGFTPPSHLVPKTVNKKEVIVLTNGDLRPAANQACWEVQKKFEKKLSAVLSAKFKRTAVRAHSLKPEEKHGFIASQREGSDVFTTIDPQAPLIVLLTSWQYSHHIAPSIVHHRGPVLILANFDGTWPGLVGALCLEGTLTSLGRSVSRLWSENFDDDFFYKGLSEWFKTGRIKHNLKHLRAVKNSAAFLKTPAGELGTELGKQILVKKEIMGLFDPFCMGMINGVFPQKALADIGMPLESLSQSMMLYEMSKVPQKLREECLQWYEKRGMKFNWGTDAKTELTRNQVLEQCAMMIAMARAAERFGLSCVGVQYQQGLKDVCAASDFAEGAIGSAERFPIPGENGKIIRQGKPIPCANEVDMGTAIPQTMLFRLLDTLGLPSETTLHDIRWGSNYNSKFIWDFEISGNVPFGHLKNGIAGAAGYRQPPMYFAKGGSTISGQCRAGSFIWARAHYTGTQVHLHIGTGDAIELPEKEFQRRLNATTKVWPLMNVELHGVSRDQLMAGHESNHITVAYVDKKHLKDVCRAFTAMALAQGMQVKLAGKPVI